MSQHSLYNTIRKLGDDVELLSIAEAILLHVVGVDDAYTCQRKFKDLIERKNFEYSAQKFRLVIASTAYININLKFFVLNVMQRRPTVQRIQKYLDIFDISRNDAVILRSLLQKSEFKRAMSQAAAKVPENLITEGAYKSVFKTFKTIYPDLMKHIRSKTFTKLRFLTVSSNTEFYDLHMELMCKALQTYIKMVPIQKSELHVANIIRTSLNNHTINMIKSYTTQKRARIINSGVKDGFGQTRFDLVTVSENQLLKAFGVAEGEEIGLDDLRDAGACFDDERARDSELNFQSIIRRYGVTAKRKTLLELLACQEHKRFSRFLRRRAKIDASKDNVDFYDTAGQEAYFDNVCRFLHLCEDKARKFVKEVGYSAYPEIAKQLETSDAAAAIAE